MTFGHDPFNGTHVPNLVQNAETASGTLAFNAWYDAITGGGDDDDNGESWWEGLVPDTFKDKVSDRLKEIQKKAKKVYGKAKEGWAFLTGSTEREPVVYTQSKNCASTTTTTTTTTGRGIDPARS